jgi:hypothetical protein
MRMPLASLPPNFRRNVYILAIDCHNPVSIPEVQDALKTCQVPHATASIAI